MLERITGRKVSFIFTVLAFSVTSCNSVKTEDSSEKIIEELSITDLAVKVDLDMDQIAYAYGSVVARRASSQVGGKINVNQFLNAFFRAKNDPSIELQAVSDRIYQLKQAQGRNPEAAGQLIEQMGLYIGAMDRANPLLKKVNVIEFTAGFQAVINGNIRPNFNADSIYQSAVEEYNKNVGMKFMAENSKRDGVEMTASGLQYRVLKLGEGEKPKKSNDVTVHYTGKLISGDIFDSSVQRGQPISFNLGGVIAGWTEGLQLMPVGSKFRFYIPQELAYGSQGMSKIPPYSALIFDVELFSFK